MKTIYIVLFLMVVCIYLLKYNKEHYQTSAAAEGTVEQLNLTMKALGPITDLSQEEKQEYARKMLKKTSRELNYLKKLRTIVDKMRIDNRSNEYVRKVLDKLAESE